MNRNLVGIVVVLVATSLGGCASMSAEECLVSDWEAIGYEDGARGYTGDRISQHRKACAKHGVAPDLTSYRAGRDSGLREYCQPSRGFNLGAGGGRYYGVCAADLEPDFLDAYRIGQQLHALRSNLYSADSAITSRENELANVKQQIRNSEAALINRDTATEDRILLLADLKELSEEVGRLEAEIVELTDERGFHERELADYEAVIADAGY